MNAADLSQDAYADASRFLSGLDPDWGRHVAQIGPCQHQTAPGREPYEALVRAVAHQQLHARAAEAILGRLLALYPGVTFPAPGQMLATPAQSLRACGFSATKMATIQTLAQATLDGVVPTREQALAMSDETLVARLITLRGIGRWTVEMLLIYTLERMDVLPADDFGVREGYRRLKALPRAPTPREMVAIGRAWRPYRTIAAWYLWRLPPQSAPA